MGRCRIWRAPTHGQAPVLRNPAAVRPWQHVLEPLYGYMRVVESIYGKPQTAPVAYNFGPDEKEKVDVGTVAKLFCDSWGGGVQPKVAAEEKPRHEAHMLALSIDKARKELGWQPRWNTKQAVEQTVAWYKAFAEAKDVQRLSLDQIERYQLLIIDGATIRLPHHRRGHHGAAGGACVARAHPGASIIIIEKEDIVAFHASGRNSGVLHAGFYYSADSLKAKFCRDGNAAMREYVKSRGLHINECQKVVVAQNEQELATLHELYKRGQVNGVPLNLVDEKQLGEIEPNAKTYKQAIHATTTAVIDPIEICNEMRKELEASGVKVLTKTAYERRISQNTIEAGGRQFEAGKIINCAGLYADKIAKDFGFCEHYAIMPFKGVYLKYNGLDRPVSKCVYPVPNIKNPFLGVHFSVTVQGTTKIGPTAIPAFWREQYGFDNFSLKEFAEIFGWEARLFLTNPNFRKLALIETRKYYPPFMAAQAAKMVKHLDTAKFSGWSRPGIRAQLVDKRSATLVHDFIVEGDKASIHVLNAVSPAFTSSYPFATWVVDQYMGAA